MPENAPRVSVTVEDLRTGRAHIHWPLHAKLNLLHWAGAPWADRAPDACLHGLQVEVLHRKERELIVHGASRLGKSVLGGCFTILAAMTFGAKVGVMAHRWDHVAHEWQYVDKGMRALFRGAMLALPRCMFRNSGNNQQYHLKTVWGSEARGHSTASDDGSAALGREFTHIILGEGSHVARRIREDRLQRGLDGALMNQRYPREDIGRFFIFTTPKGYEGCAAFRVEQIRKDCEGNIHGREYGRAPWKETCWVREAIAIENPAYDKEAFEAARRTLSAAAFQEQYMGKMVYKTGRVYEEFDEDHNVVPLPPAERIRGMRLALGVDTGACFGAVLLGLDEDENLWVLDEVYTEQKDIDTSTAQVNAMIDGFFRAHFGFDDAKMARIRIESMFVDPASQHKIELRNRVGMQPLNPWRRQGAFDLLPTIDQLRSHMALGRFRVATRCVNTIDQLRRYVWKETTILGSKEKAIREPRKDYDHLCDAMRFGAIPLMERGALEDAPVLTLEQAQKAANRSLFFGDMQSQMHHANRNQEEIP